MFNIPETGNQGAITPVLLPDDDNARTRSTVLPKVLPALNVVEMPPRAMTEVDSAGVTNVSCTDLTNLEQALLEQIIEAMHQRDARKITNAATLFQHDPNRFNYLFKQLRGEILCRGLHDFHMRFLMSKERDDGMFMVCFPGSVLPQVVVRLKRR